MSVCRAGEKLWLWRRLWENCQKLSLAVIHCAGVYQGKLVEDSPRSAALPGLPSPTPSQPASAGDGLASHQAGVSTELANVGGRRAGGIKQGHVGREVLRAAGEMFIQSHRAHVWFPEGEHGLQSLLYPWAQPLSIYSRGDISSGLGLPKGEGMRDRKGHGGVGRAVLWGLSSPCGAGGFWDQEGKERAGAGVRCHGWIF